ncbi:MAG: CsgG/HfaB family protein [Desulfuromonadaceae bacterium]
MMRRLLVLLTVCLGCVLCGCATTYVEEPPSLAPSPDLASFPPYDGPKTVVAVLPLGLSERAAKAYPHLLSKDVGLGVHNRVIENLYDTNRFRFVEEKPEVIKNVLDRQWMSMAGMVDQGTAVEMGRLLGARKVIYGEVYDFAQGGEQISGFSAKKNFNTRMGIQVRCVDVETLEFVPGSGVGRGRDVGEASAAAIREAVAGLIRRMQ